MRNPQAVKLLLRLSIASVFLYAAIAATLQPYNWVGYFPLFLRHTFSQTLLLGGFSMYQVVLSLWLISGWKERFAALLASITLVAIIVANVSQLDILFRDFAIFFASVALFFAEEKK